ncbi:probable serine/threonine-protein kinase PBL28 isoform X2 [Neltuma alba]|uniref:probable serine/threonine-protein kinase PBL28 isoform X2 n=1 Tax=Neltuma alba TaxID=207710 RepID=UPI0010A55521|nr:probable serine/threonine-protein kinase PBL28 isoform X2 [Prosopis alba]
MRLICWQQLPLLMVIQLLYPNKSSSTLYAEALFTFKITLGSPQQISCSIAKYPGAFPLSNGVPAKIDGTNEVPTLTPLQEAQVKRPGGTSVAAIVGGVAAAVLVIVIVVIVYACLMRVKRLIRQTSDTASSFPSPTVELGTRSTSQDTRRFTIMELEQATRNFSESNLAGEGRFGLVYKGLLQDGSIVAIKRRQYALIHSFIPKVMQIANIHHIHLVKLIGYYEDGYQQLLVHEYLPNGNVGNHLYDNEGLPIGRLDMQRRLSIALGASKGMEHLHCLAPPMLHTNFRTSNVLVDESFTAKVSDYGLCKLLANSDHAGSSSNTDFFRDPELNQSKDFSKTSDIYSFGVFLLELISGREVHKSNSAENLVFQVNNSHGVLEEFVDATLGGHEKQAAKKVMKLATMCLNESTTRPSMAQIVREVEQIQREFSSLHSYNTEVIGGVTLGSDLFK